MKVAANALTALTLQALTPCLTILGFRSGLFGLRSPSLSASLLPSAETATAHTGSCWRFSYRPLLAGILVAILRERSGPPSRIVQIGAFVVVGFGVLWGTGVLGLSDIGIGTAPSHVSADTVSGAPHQGQRSLHVKPNLSW